LGKRSSTVDIKTYKIGKQLPTFSRNTQECFVLEHCLMANTLRNHEKSIGFRPNTREVFMVIRFDLVMSHVQTTWRPKRLRVNWLGIG